jgi:dienelactone hydrolase
MKKTIALLLSTLLLLTVVACGPVSPKPDALKASDMAYALADSTDVDVIAFNLGEGELKNSSGKDVPCPLDGIIGIPSAAGPHPLVVIFHGVTPIENNYDKTYAGFDYLVKQLAAEGYVALSFNINAEYNCMEYGDSIDFEWAYTIYQQQMTLLERANAGNNPGYDIDLTGKIDFDNIHFMGHSRGGEIADSFIRTEQAEGLGRIKSLIRVEATAAYFPNGEPHPDLPIGIIIGEYDGDVPEDGQSVFDDIQKEANRTSSASIVFLRGANHAYFNRAFLPESNKYGSDAEDKLLSRERQEGFLTCYAAAFLSVHAKGAAPWGVWDNHQAEPNTMFGYPVTASYYMPGRQTLLTASEAEAAKLTTTGAAEARYTAQTAPYGILFTHPGGTLSDKELALINLRWSAKGGTVSIPCNADFAGRSALSLYVAVDSSDALNAKGAPQSFTVTLKDASGVAQTVLVPKGTSALSYYPGFAEHFEADEFSPAFDVWNGYMPLGNLRIPLTYFDTLNLGAIAEIVIGLDQTDAGSVMLSGVYLEN